MSTPSPATTGVRHPAGKGRSTAGVGSTCRTYRSHCSGDSAAARFTLRHAARCPPRPQALNALRFEGRRDLFEGRRDLFKASIGRLMMERKREETVVAWLHCTGCGIRSAPQCGVTALHMSSRMLVAARFWTSAATAMQWVWQQSDRRDSPDTSPFEHAISNASERGEAGLLARVHSARVTPRFSSCQALRAFTGPTLAIHAGGSCRNS
jgi:hypothetical protein